MWCDASSARSSPRSSTSNVPLALVNDEGRVVLSTEPKLQVGQLTRRMPRASRTGTPLRVLDPRHPGRAENHCYIFEVHRADEALRAPERTG